MFAPWLDGHRLLANLAHLRGSAWISFPRVANETWVMGNVVLMGDAAHSAHFSIGSGTKLALEDAISLARASTRVGRMCRRRCPRTKPSARPRSCASSPPLQFDRVVRKRGAVYAFGTGTVRLLLLTRSQRISHENLRLRDRTWLEGLERWLADQAGLQTNKPIPPMFLPFRLRDMKLANRVVVSPMATYSAADGMPNDFHLVHLGARALGGAGLVYTEMVCVTPQGRITPGCAGLWSAAQRDAWAHIVAFVHARSAAKLCLQLGHSGPKGSTQLGWEEMDAPLAEGNWELIAPSPIAWSERNQIPRQMTRDDMEAIREAFVVATRHGAEAGFDMLELHAAHGYLISAFLSPLTNHRTDAYGGALEIGCGFRWKYFERCARRGRRRSRCRCASRRPTGWTAAIRRTTRWRLRARSRTRALI